VPAHQRRGERRGVCKEGVKEGACAKKGCMKGHRRTRKERKRDPEGEQIRGVSVDTNTFPESKPDWIQ